MIQSVIAIPSNTSHIPKDINKFLFVLFIHSSPSNLFHNLLFSYTSSPYIVKSFFLIFQGFFSSISQMNEPRGWTFLCIWYESRGFWVHEVKRHHISFYMALCIPILLRQRTSRVYQDHLHFCRVLTSFVPPVHNQGVSLAPLQGHALW